MFFCAVATPAAAQVHINIGISLPSYPVLQRVPGYPVYYAPRLNSNYFFYDGLYWVYEGDNWYASPWYNGPWDTVDRYQVPSYLLRVPVRYYRSAPVYFRGWRADSAPRWGDHWGSSWEQQRSGWNTWNRNSVPAAAPLPVYQNQYSGNRYPDRSQQVVIQSSKYNYQPNETVVRERYQQYRASAPAVQAQRESSHAAAPQAQSSPPQGHPPGKAKGWEGQDHPPGNAKGQDKEPKEEHGKGHDKEKEDHGKGHNK
jgi:hypothetical protein